MGQFAGLPPRWPVRIAKLLAIQALGVVLGVLPAVANDPFQGAAPARALPAFGALILVWVVVAGLLAVRRHAARQGAGWTAAAVLVGSAALLADAAAAFAGHGPALRVATAVLAATSLLDLGVGVAMAVTLLRGRACRARHVDAPPA